MAHGHSDVVGYLAVIREFDGKLSGMSVNEFLYQVTEVGKLNNWDEQKMISIARLRMTGLARTFRDHTDQFTEISVWADFCKIMKARFIPVTSKMATFSKYTNASQRVNETYFEFATRLSMLYDRAHPLPVDASVAVTTCRLASKNTEIKLLFLHGLIDKPLALRVMNANPISLQQTAEFASLFQANMKAIDNLNNDYPSININPLSGVTNVHKICKLQNHPPKKHQKPINSLHHLSDQATQAKQNQNNFTACYTCGATNHYANGCAHNLGTKRNNKFTECYKCGATNHFANGCTRRLQNTKINL